MQNPQDRLVSYAELETLYGITYSRMQLWRLERAGKFPLRVPLSSARVAWLASELSAWIAKRAAERHNTPVAA